MADDLKLEKVNKKKVGFCRFKEMDGRYLLTNEIGGFVFLTPPLFKQFVEGTLDKKSLIYKQLEENYFIKDELDTKSLVEKYSCRKDFLLMGPSLHIVVVTLRCNQNCIYCQTSSSLTKGKSFDMTLETAKKTVDVIFKAPNHFITIEFQGGEPLINWPVIKYIVQYAKEKNKKAKKDLRMSMVSNFTLMDEEKYKFLSKNKVGICTSLDGPEMVHDRNRPWSKGSSHKNAVSWIKKMKKREENDPSLYHVSAVLTASKFSLKYPKEIIDEYLSLGFGGIHLRPLSFLGFSGKRRIEIGYSMKEFLEFWKEAMDYIIEINKKGINFQEIYSRILLKKIFDKEEPNYGCLASPCGAVIGQLLYNFDGNVFTCDEGRMVGDDTFLLGNVEKNSYEEIIFNDTSRSICTASLLDNLPCDYCVYKPYCGVCPVVNYALNKDIFAFLPGNEKCELNKRILDYLFRKLENKETRKVFKKWISFTGITGFPNITS